MDSAVDMTRRIYGALLGQAVADSIGATFEGQTPEWLHGRFETSEVMFLYSADAPRRYTDDTEMALALAEYLVSADTIESQSLMQSFVDRYDVRRGYGRGTRRLVDAFRLSVADLSLIHI